MSTSRGVTRLRRKSAARARAAAGAWTSRWRTASTISSSPGVEPGSWMGIRAFSSRRSAFSRSSVVTSLRSAEMASLSLSITRVWRWQVALSSVELGRLALRSEPCPPLLGDRSVWLHSGLASSDPPGARVRVQEFPADGRRISLGASLTVIARWVLRQDQGSLSVMQRYRARQGNPD